MTKHFQILVFSVFALVGCQKDELEKRGYAIVVTNVEVDEYGATFGIDILSSSSDIIEKGFYWGSDELDEIQIVIDPSESKYNLRTDIPEGIQFYVKAYAKTKDYISYGEREFFTSLGFVQKELEVSGFSPENVTDGDIIKIVGTGFSWQKENISINVGGKNAAIISASSDSILFELPLNITEGNHEIDITVYSKSLNVLGIEVHSPKINDLNLYEAFDKSALTVNGDYFRLNSQVHLDGVLAEVISVENNTMVVKTPLTTSSGNVKLTVTNSNKTSSEIDFTILDHQIQDITADKFKVGNLVTVSGYGFVQPNATTVNVEGANAEIVSLKDSEIVFRLPNHNDNASSTVQVVNGLKIRDVEIVREKSWTQLSDFPGTARGGAVITTHDNKIYYGLGRSLPNGGGTRFVDFWKYDPDFNNWTQLSNCPTIPTHARYLKSFVVNDEIHVINYYVSPSWHYIYNPLNDTWREGPYRNSYTGIGESINVLSLNGSSYNWIFEYMQVFDSEKNEWMDIDVGARLYEQFGFIYNGELYWIGLGSSHMELRKFDSINGTMNFIGDLSSAYITEKNQSFAQEENRGIFVQGTVVLDLKFGEFNLFRRENHPVVLKNTSSAFIDGKMYLIGGFKSNIPQTSIWLFDTN